MAKCLLYRLPFQMDLDLLSGAKLTNLSKESGSTVLSIGGAGSSSTATTFMCSHDRNKALCDKLRPIVRQQIDDNLCLGPAFTGTITISKSILSSIPKDSDKPAIPLGVSASFFLLFFLFSSFFSFKFGALLLVRSICPLLVVATGFSVISS